jgi:hypothetical protein
MDAVYRVPVGIEALKTRVLAEATRLRDAFPTRNFGAGRAKPLMIIPYTDGFDLLHFPLASHPFGWLNVKVEPGGSTCRLLVTRRRRPRPERIALVILPLVLVPIAVLSAMVPDAHAAIAMVPLAVVVVFVFAFVALVERFQERRLLDLLLSMFPGSAEEPQLGLR